MGQKYVFPGKQLIPWLSLVQVNIIILTTLLYRLTTCNLSRVHEL